MISRRKVLLCFCGIGLSQILPKAHAMISLTAIPILAHEQAMRAAITEAKLNSAYPFGSIIADASTGEILAKGVNITNINPTFHGEIVCLNNYVTYHGNSNWANLILYTTGEPCPMCMGALTWAGIGGVVFASSIATLIKAGIKQINISAKSVIQASDSYRPEILGGILATETDVMFLNRKGI